jgi:hypothetical protein
VGRNRLPDSRTALASRVWLSHTGGSTGLVSIESFDSPKTTVAGQRRNLTGLRTNRAAPTVHGAAANRSPDRHDDRGDLIDCGA